MAVSRVTSDCLATMVIVFTPALSPRVMSTFSTPGSFSVSAAVTWSLQAEQTTPVISPV